jgi:hypothetical protein
MIVMGEIGHYLNLSLSGIGYVRAGLMSSISHGILGLKRRRPVQKAEIESKAIAAMMPPLKPLGSDAARFPEGTAHIIALQYRYEGKFILAGVLKEN